ncbi:hypothetical protein DFR29_102326 [Tahibacter aquaticus]|uniref:Uncharacterized protein n=1 Tax=Tahibacter aquaticus TaxID=520092 RepID=A0A4V3DN99_9GAMM|nr:hypothetical protein [Tahibacter aquaticus]TDR47666.1 hypothetical protein DFR29_102326 [Tahibacter aquaticus]
MDRLTRTATNERSTGPADRNNYAPAAMTAPREEHGFSDRLAAPRYRADRGDLAALMLLYGAALACFLVVASASGAPTAQQPALAPAHLAVSLDSTDRS